MYCFVIDCNGSKNCVMISNFEACEKLWNCFVITYKKFEEIMCILK